MEREELRLRSTPGPEIPKRGHAESILAVLTAKEAAERQNGNQHDAIYAWNRRFAGVDIGELRQCGQMREENSKLKRLAVVLALDNRIVQDVAAKSCKAWPRRKVAR